MTSLNVYFVHFCSPMVCETSCGACSCGKSGPAKSYFAISSDSMGSWWHQFYDHELVYFYSPMVYWISDGA